MNALVPRDDRGRILKGHSGNPNGRPKYDALLIEQARATGATALGILHNIIHDPTAFGPRGWLEQKQQVSFLTMAMDRVFGAAKTGILPDDKPDTTPNEAPLLSALDSAVAELTAIRKAAALIQPIDVTPSKHEGSRPRDRNST